jgi:hypothetical protein
VLHPFRAVSWVEGKLVCLLIVAGESVSRCVVDGRKACLLILDVDESVSHCVTD